MSDAFSFDLKSKVRQVKPSAHKPNPIDDERVDEVAERREFTSREPATRIKRERGKSPSGPIEVLSVKGPLEVVNRFKAYCNEKGYPSYWQALDAMLKKEGA